MHDWTALALDILKFLLKDLFDRYYNDILVRPKWTSMLIRFSYYVRDFFIL